MESRELPLEFLRNVVLRFQSCFRLTFVNEFRRNLLSNLLYVCGVGTQMQELQVHLEKLLRDAAECKLISDLSTDRDKQGLFARMAEHYEMLAAEIERTIAERLGGEPTP